MKKSVKTGFGIAALSVGVLLISSCTANFCSNTEKAKMMYNLEQGVTVYVDDEDLPENAESLGYTKLNENVYAYVPLNEDGTYLLSNKLNTVISTVTGAGGYAPTKEYFAALDAKLLDCALTSAGKNINDITKASEISSLKYDVATATISIREESENPSQSILHNYGYLKYYSTEEDALWGNYSIWNAEIALAIGDEKCPTQDFTIQYVNAFTNEVNSYRSCIATQDGEYGTYGQFDETISIKKKTWGYAWKKGLIEGLLVYPVAWLVDSFCNIFGGVQATGAAQLGALAIVTLIVRLFIFACSFRSTLQQQKMQALQPQLQKLQEKYPNSNTNQAEKQRLAEEQMKLYKKNGVKPFAQLLVLIVQFPVFIGVWGAMQGSSALSTGSFLGLKLSSSISSVLMAGFKTNVSGFWTALVLFVLMAVSQVLAMKIPQWIQNKKTKQTATKLGKNPAQDQQNKTMKMVSWVMVIMIIFMGFSLPAAMGVYWFIGAIISLIQSIITTTLSTKKR